MKILVDMNLSPKWAIYLTENDIEAIHWSSIGNPSSPDTDIFIYAETNDFTILTKDLDFGFLLAITHTKKPSVVQIRADALRRDEIGSIVVSAIKTLTNDIEKGTLITIDKNKTRVTLLPL